MRSNIKLLGLAAAVAAFVLIRPASANLAELLGDWHNVDPNARGIVRIVIADAGGAIEVHVWGSCHPTPCNWGTVRAIPYAPNVNAPLPGDAQYLQADYPESFAAIMLIIGPAPQPGGELRTIALTRFTDNSGRSDYAEVNVLKK